ncbi:MAG: hypothetical protein ACI4DY_13320 [Monoglobaceae bacterium]
MAAIAISEMRLCNKNDAYNNLRIGIIKQAVRDYENALKKLERYRRSKNPLPEAMREYIDKARSFERFFLSEWGQLLSSNRGQDIIKNAQNEVYTELAR